MSIGGGGKGGSQSTAVKLPGFIEEAAQRAIQRGETAGQIGHVPYSGPDVAAFTPQQEAAFAATNQAAEAFGLPLSMGSPMPEPTDFGGGLLGYSSRPIYDQAIGVLMDERPGQYQAITDTFIDPVTGQMANPQPQPVAPVVPGSSQSVGGDDNDHFSRGYGGGGGHAAAGGFTSFRDMFDGGGAGASGDTFQGGGLVSDLANKSKFRGLLL